MVEIIPAPGTLQTFEEIASRLHQLLGLTEWAHIDFIDNTLFPNTTPMDFDTCKPFSEQVSLEAHLMVAQPEKYIKFAADAGFKRLIAHVEAHDPRLFLDQAKYEHVEAGIAIDGATEFEEVEPFLEEVDFVLVMTVEAGASGEPFLPECIEKIKAIHNYLPDLPIEVEGGISDVTARLVTEAGATRLVSTSYIFRDPAHIAEAIDALRNG